MKEKSSDYIGKAILISLILIVISLIGGFAHLWFVSWFKYVSAIVLVGGLIICCRQFGEQQGQGVTFGKLFGFGFRITLSVTVLMVIFQFLSMYLIFPELKDLIMEKARTEMEANPKYTPELIDQSLAMTKKLFLPFAIIGTILFNLFFGVIGSLLGGAFTRKSEPDIFQDNIVQ